MFPVACSFRQGFNSQHDRQKGMLISFVAVRDTVRGVIAVKIHDTLKVETVDVDYIEILDKVGSLEDFQEFVNAKRALINA